MADKNYTCSDCEALNIFSEPQEIGVKKYQCTRNPPSIVPIMTQQGLQIISMYPPISHTMIACCEALIDDEDDIPDPDTH